MLFSTTHARLRPAFVQVRGGLRRAANRIGWPRGGAILAYHRVTELESDPNLLAVTPDTFRDQLTWLQAHIRLISLSEMLERIEDNKSLSGCGTITFDDGYSDNLSNALPILTDLGIPATFFITTQNVVEPGLFWWDELEGLLLSPGVISDQRLAGIGLLKKEELDGPEGTTVRLPIDESGWNLFSVSDPSSRHTLYRRLCSQLRRVQTSSRDALLHSLRGEGHPLSSFADAHRPLNITELKKLAGSALSRIGSHTVSHSCMTALDTQALFHEMKDSKRDLEQLVGQEIEHLAVPYGDRKSIPRDLPAAARKAGYSSALTTTNRFVRASTDPFRLPRILIRDEKPSSLARSLGFPSGG